MRRARQLASSGHLQRHKRSMHAALNHIVCCDSTRWLYFEKHVAARWLHRYCEMSQCSSLNVVQHHHSDLHWQERRSTGLILQHTWFVLQGGQGTERVHVYASWTCLLPWCAVTINATMCAQRVPSLFDGTWKESFSTVVTMQVNHGQANASE